MRACLNLVRVLTLVNVAMLVWSLSACEMGGSAMSPTLVTWDQSGTQDIQGYQSEVLCCKAAPTVNGIECLPPGAAPNVDYRQLRTVWVGNDLVTRDQDILDDCPDICFPDDGQAVCKAYEVVTPDAVGPDGTTDTEGNTDGPCLTDTGKTLKDYGLTSDEVVYRDSRGFTCTSAIPYGNPRCFPIRSIKTPVLFREDLYSSELSEVVMVPVTNELLETYALGAGEIVWEIVRIGNKAVPACDSSPCKFFLVRKVLDPDTTFLNTATENSFCK